MISNKLIGIAVAVAAAAFLLSLPCQAQVVTETVDFNNYISPTENDLYERFQFNSGGVQDFIEQSPVGGITGGALVPPDQISWGNDVLIYCSTYAPVIGSTMSTSISFKRNVSLINPNAGQRPVVIILHDFMTNRSVSTTISANVGIQVISYSYAQHTQVNLQDGRWYELRLSVTPIGGQFNDVLDVEAQVFDLGTDGTGVPESVGLHSATIYDDVLVGTTELQVRISGTQWGGAEYIDNFVFSGPKHGDLCFTTRIAEKHTERLSILPNPATDRCIIKSEGPIARVVILDALGRMVSNHTGLDRREISLSLEDLRPGMHLVQVIGVDGGVHTQRLVVER